MIDSTGISSSTCGICSKNASAASLVSPDAVIRVCASTLAISIWTIAACSTAAIRV
jgi:hypothetical protein